MYYVVIECYALLKTNKNNINRIYVCKISGRNEMKFVNEKERQSICSIEIFRFY